MSAPSTYAEYQPIDYALNLLASHKVRGRKAATVLAVTTEARKAMVRQAESMDSMKPDPGQTTETIGGVLIVVDDSIAWMEPR